MIAYITPYATYVAMDGARWDHIYSYLGPWSIRYGLSWDHMTTYMACGAIWHKMSPDYGSIWYHRWPDVVPYGGPQNYLAMYGTRWGYIYIYISIFGAIWHKVVATYGIAQYISLYGAIWQNIWGHVAQDGTTHCQSMGTYVAAYMAI